VVLEYSPGDYQPPVAFEALLAGLGNSLPQHDGKAIRQLTRLVKLCDSDTLHFDLPRQLVCYARLAIGIIRHVAIVIPEDIIADIVLSLWKIFKARDCLGLLLFPRYETFLNPIF